MRLLIGALVLAMLSASPQTRTLNDNLDLYAEGLYARALAPIATTDQLAAAYGELSTTGAQWIARGATDAERSRRRLVAAVFALNLAAVHDEASALALRLKLVAWGGVALTSEPAIFADANHPLALPASNLPTQPGEREWFLAAIAFLESAGWQGLVDPAPQSRTLSVIMPQLRPPPAYSQLSLALNRFPNDPRFLLARAATAEHFGCLQVRPGDPLRVLANTGRADLPDTELCLNAREEYEKLLASDGAADEAHLRTGYLLLSVSGQGSLARQHFNEAARLTSSPNLRFLSHMLSGWLSEQEGNPGDAERSYRTALAVVPGARSASTLLAALLFSADVSSERRAEAATLMDAVLTSVPPVLDPWEELAKGDGRSWPALLGPLRERLK